MNDLMGDDEPPQRLAADQIFFLFSRMEMFQKHITARWITRNTQADERRCSMRLGARECCCVRARGVAWRDFFPEVSPSLVCVQRANRNDFFFSCARRCCCDAVMHAALAKILIDLTGGPEAPDPLGRMDGI